MFLKSGFARVVVRVFLKAENAIMVCMDKYGNTALHIACEELIIHGAIREAEKVILKTEYKISQCNT